ncbi:hypothetical protein S40285_06002 [Stachybotrys chlorohalonatus IBT 40285]|uniref:Dienelactone hydrolase domain-containing protein n=1 Tax=Stachybotrys chlorohalonatus (strain IBT 40285) TaxID=1283841 RepID=A0A084R0M3_STAC4|nr:hypothetical protein S40285_06002 [Stachybotrys chlorohalonata IBT 40285]
MSFTPCCFQSFQWHGQPSGRIDKLAGLNVYVAGNDSEDAVLFIHDLYGWTYPNIRLLADHFAKEANVTVYVPDFFDGEVLSFDLIDAEDWAGLDVPGFIGRNSRAAREPQIFDCARALRNKYRKVAAVGYCYGGWASFRLGAREHQPPLVDCISVGHPSLLTKEDIDGVGVPVQMLAPEIDAAYTAEMKLHTFQTLQASGLVFDYQHFPGVQHSCLIRGNDKVEGEREAMVRGKDAVVWWLKQFLSKSA